MEKDILERRRNWGSGLMLEVGDLFNVGSILLVNVGIRIVALY